MNKVEERFREHTVADAGVKYSTDIIWDCEATEQCRRAFRAGRAAGIAEERQRIVTALDQIEACILSMMNHLLFGDGHGLDGGARERLLRAWYDVEGDNVRHALNQLVRGENAPREEP